MPDLSNTDQQSDNKLLIPMIVDSDVSKGSNQVEMTLVNQHSLTNDSRVNMTKKTSMSEQERSSAIDNLDSIVCQMIDESIDQVDETDVAEEISETKPSWKFMFCIKKPWNKNTLIETLDAKFFSAVYFPFANF